MILNMAEFLDMEAIFKDIKNSICGMYIWLNKIRDMHIGL